MADLRRAGRLTHLLRGNYSSSGRRCKPFSFHRTCLDMAEIAGGHRNEPAATSISGMRGLPAGGTGPLSALHVRPAIVIIPLAVVGSERQTARPAVTGDPGLPSSPLRTAPAASPDRRGRTRDGQRAWIPLRAGAPEHGRNRRALRTRSSIAFAGAAARSAGEFHSTVRD